MSTLRVPINIVWPGTGSPGVNVWHVRTASSVFDQLELDAAVAELRTFYNALANMYATGVVLSLGDITDVESQEYRTSSFANVTSTTSGAVMPPSQQFCISWRTSLAARRGMGRTFIGPLSTLTMDADGTPTASALNVVQTAANALVDASTAAGAWSIGIYGLQQPAPPLTSNYADLPHVIRDVTRAKVTDKFAVLRSRRD